MALKIICILLLIGSIFEISKSTVSLRSFSEWCFPSASFTIAVSDMVIGLGTNQARPYDYMSFVESSSKESVALLLSFNGMSSIWNFYWVDKTATWNTKSITINQSSNYLNMISSFIFIMNGTSYYCLRFNDTDPATPIWYTFNTTDFATGGYQRFYPYSVDFVTNIIYVLFQDLTTSKVVTYQWVSGVMTMNPISVGPLLPFWPQTVTGNGFYLLDRPNNKFAKLSNGTWTYTTFVSIADSTDVVKFYQMREQIAFISVTKANLKSGDLYYIIGSTQNKFIINQTLSTTDVGYYTDEINNFMRVVSYELFWVTITSTKDFRVSLLNSTEIPNLNLVMAVAMSQNKASIFYTDGKVEYYKHIANNSLEKQFTVTSSATMNLATTKTYQIGLSCICQNINQMACFSQNLYCVVITRGSAICKGAGDSYTTW